VFASLRSAKLRAVVRALSNSTLVATRTDIRAPALDPLN